MKKCRNKISHIRETKEELSWIPGCITHIDPRLESMTSSQFPMCISKGRRAQEAENISNKERFTMINPLTCARFYS